VGGSWAGVVWGGGWGGGWGGWLVLVSLEAGGEQVGGMWGGGGSWGGVGGGGVAGGGGGGGLGLGVGGGLWRVWWGVCVWVAWGWGVGGWGGGGGLEPVGCRIAMMAHAHALKYNARHARRRQVSLLPPAGAPSAP